MQPEAAVEVESFLKTVAESNRSLLMLDYDGTLAPFHRDRSQAFPYEGVIPLLQQVISEGHTRVVMVSGRDSSETAALLGLNPAPEMWGLHGLQRRLPGGKVETLPIPPAIAEALSDADRWLNYQQLHPQREVKTGSIAVHWRGLTARECEEIRARVLLGWRTISEASGLQLLEFDGGVEIHAPDADKGDAVRTLLREVGPNVPAAYLGDDVTDERAFRALGERGLTVLVRPHSRRTAARAWLKPPEELLWFLQQWRDASQRHGRRSGNTARAGTP